MPRACAAHAEARDRHAVRVHIEALGRVITAFKHVRLTRTLEAVAVAPKGMDHDRARWLKLPGLLRHQP